MQKSTFRFVRTVGGFQPALTGVAFAIDDPRAGCKRVPPRALTARTLLPEEVLTGFLWVAPYHPVVKTETGRKTAVAEAIGLLDLVVPFTTPELTRAAVAAAERLGAGLQGAIRLLRIAVVPYPLDIQQPDVNLKFLRRQAIAVPCSLPMRAEIALGRDYDTELKKRLSNESVVILATKSRWWFSPQWRLAARLRRQGYNIVLIQRDNHA